MFEAIIERRKEGEEMKPILDVCCGSKMFYFNKNDQRVHFNDIRSEHHILCDGRKLDINPDTKYDFRNLPFEDNTFNLVVFDPPHLLKIGESSWMAKKYGKLPKDWKLYIKSGFDECIRVLKPHGTLIFKWSEADIKQADILKVIDYEPIFGDRGRGKNSIWLVFMKENG